MNTVTPTETMNTTPIFTPQHFSDYGFDPQLDYFQVLEEARRHKRESSSSSSRSAIDNLHFKLQKPISKDYDNNSKKIKKNRKRWWKNALLFFKRKRPSSSSSDGSSLHSLYGGRNLSGPVYLADSRSGSGSGSGSSTPYHLTSTSRPSSGPLAGTMTARKDEFRIPYISLTEMNLDQSHKMAASPMPIYLVT